jgi:hypothetical protein
MQPEIHPLIAKLTESLASKPEQRSEACALLSEKFDHTHVEVKNTLSILESNQRRRFPRFRMVLLWMLAIFVFFFALVTKKADFAFSRMMYDFDFLDPLPKPEISAKLTTEQRLLLGDSKLDDLAQKRQLHIHAPKNPVYYAVYVAAYLSKNENLPPNYDETVASIAPNNALFLYLKAASIGKKAYRKNPSGTKAKPRIINGVRRGSLPQEIEFTIIDQVAFEHSLKIIAQATSLPSFESYFSKMITAKQLPLSIRNLREYLASIMYFYGTADFGIIRTRHIADIMNARAEQLSKNASKDEFVALAKQRDAFITHLGRNPDICLVGELVHSVIAMATAKNFEAAATRLGLNEIAVFYGKQSQAFAEERDRRDAKNSTQNDENILKRGSILHQLSLLPVRNQLIAPPAIDAADFEPLRRAEYDFLNGVSVILIAQMLIPASLLIFFLRFLFRVGIRYPARKMAHVLNPLDWVWVITLGVFLPILCYVIVTHLTPLSGREYNFTYFQFLFPSIQIVALLLTILYAPIVIVRWRLAKRLAPFHLGDRFTVRVSLFTLALILLWSFTALPLVEYFGIKNCVLLFALSLPPIFSIAVILAHLFRAIFGRFASRITECATTIAVLPAYPVAIVMLCLVSQLYSAGERNWITKERLLRLDPKAPDLGAYEFKVAAQKRAQINEITGVKQRE